MSKINPMQKNENAAYEMLVDEMKEKIKMQTAIW